MDYSEYLAKNNKERSEATYLEYAREEVAKREPLMEFLESDLYKEVFKEGFAQKYVAEALKMYAETNDERYIRQASAPIYLENYLNAVVELLSNIDDELKRYYSKHSGDTHNE